MGDFLFRAGCSSWKGVLCGTAATCCMVQVYRARSMNARKKGSDHYSALGLPGKIAEDLKGAIVQH